MSIKKETKLVIDASNIISGGGLTHLKEFVRHANPKEYGFDCLILWTTTETLNCIDDKEWLTKCSHPFLNKSYVHRFIWKHFVLKPTLSDNDVLFIPGTGYLNTKANVVTMCRNLLPIDKSEMNRFFPSFKWLRYWMLRIQHFNAYKKADGVIFLNNYCFNALPQKTSDKVKSYEVIPHGLNENFKKGRKTDYSTGTEYHFIYLSRVNLYKHQWLVAKAIYELKDEGYPVKITLAGGENGPGSMKLESVINLYKTSYPDTLIMKDLIPYEELPEFYKEADIFIFASSCETFGNILLEAMGVGLPIVCSNASSMQELLHDAGVYFDPEDIDSIKSALKRLLSDEDLRRELGKKAAKLSDSYSWEKSSKQTLQYISEVYNK